MGVLKAPPKQPKTTVVQLRLDDGAREKLTQYAEFLDCSPSYVVTEALKLVCNKDKEFQSWLLRRHPNKQEPLVKGESLQLELKQESMHRRLQFDMRGNPASNRRHDSREGQSSLSDGNGREEENPTSLPVATGDSHGHAGTGGRLHAASARAATVERE